MFDGADLADAFARNIRVIKMQTTGLTHADSLLQPTARGNCLNWVLGHLLNNRNRVLQALGEEPVAAEAEMAHYLTDSEPVTGDEQGVWALESLLDALGRAQERIAGVLHRATPAELAKEIEIGERKMTVGQRVFFFYFHETYHVGQTELLRQLAGTDDKVI
jgi:uncharacterized damage-inducible protein DinB